MEFSTASFLATLAADATSLSVLSAADPLHVVDLWDWELSDTPGSANVAPLLPACPIVGVRESGQPPSVIGPESVPDFVDVVVDTGAELAQIQTVVAKCPHAATLFVQLLRHTESVSVSQGLFAESLAYSTLQHGVEFAQWLKRQESTKSPSNLVPEAVSGDVVRTVRTGPRLEITLNRPDRKNAFSAEMRDLLCEALELALLDERITDITLTGAGSAFCAGGDLQEFGEARDAAIAHLSRTTRSAGALLHRLQQRVSVTVQGACIGAGIELPAFTHRVRAHTDSFFVLPEVSLGLVPGAGGCVSLPRRIGRHRTAFMGLTGMRIGAAQALDWGLVDELVDGSGDA